MGRTDNKGMEGLALTPDGKTLVGIMQAPLIQDAGKDRSGQQNRSHCRHRHRDRRHEGIRLQPDTGSGVSDIVALNDHQFLVDERDGHGRANGNDAVPAAVHIDTNGATDVTDLSNEALKDAAIPRAGLPRHRCALGAAGIPPSEVPAKIEGIGLRSGRHGRRPVEHTLYVPTTTTSFRKSRCPTALRSTIRTSSSCSASPTPIWRSSALIISTRGMSRSSRLSTWASIVFGFLGWDF